MKKEKVSKKELAWYIIGGILAFFGLTLIVFGIIGNHMNTTTDNNFVKQAENAVMSALNIKLDFRMWGIIFLLVGMIVVVIALNFNAKKTDREVEKTIRRQQRLNAGMNVNTEVKSAVEIIEDVPSQPVEEKKK